MRALSLAVAVATLVAPTLALPALAATTAATGTVVVAKTDAEALKNCGAKPKTTGAWKCVGKTHDTASTKTDETSVHFTYQKIVWTWVDGGKTAQDSWDK